MLNSTLEQLRDKLLLLIYIYSYQSGTFTLSSGLSSDYFIDGKQVTMDPEGLYTAAQYILTSLQKHSIQAETIGGLTLGADPIAAAVTVLSQIWRENAHIQQAPAPLSSFIVRKETKTHGTRSRIEGPFHRGMQAIIVDDVLTTGGSVLKAAAAVEDAGGIVSAIYVLVDRLEGGREAIKNRGYLLDVAVNRKSLERLQQKVEERYPSLSRSLQAEEVLWNNLPLDELQTGHPALAAALKKISMAVESSAPDPVFLQQIPGKIFSAVKAAVHHPHGEKEALRLVKLLQDALTLKG